MNSLHFTADHYSMNNPITLLESSSFVHNNDQYIVMVQIHEIQLYVQNMIVSSPQCVIRPVHSYKVIAYIFMMLFCLLSTLHHKKIKHMMT